ncbi:MAG: ribbon-helix-helix protein, CopG family [Clostridia bacterium]|nr:ribbon-helix-helix protein, CopG family [Clostridia bacterium]
MEKTSRRRILNISIPAPLYDELEAMARNEAKTKAEFAREAIRLYIEREKRWQRIREWGRQTVRELGLKGEEEVENAAR